MWHLLFSKLTGGGIPGGQARDKWRGTVWAGCFLILLVAAGVEFRQARHVATRNQQEIGKSAAAARYWDEIFYTGPTTGNTLLRFEGYDASQPDQWDVMLAGYTRGSYSLFPQRVYINDPAQPVSMGQQAKPFPDFSPPPGWTEQHDITSIVVVRRGADGSINAEHIQSATHAGTVARGQAVGRPGAEHTADTAAWFGMLAYFGLLLATGYAVASLACDLKLKSPPEIVGLAGLLGAAVVPWVLFCVSLAGARPGRWTLGMIFAADVATIIWVARRGQLAIPRYAASRWRWSAVLGLPFALLGAWAFTVFAQQVFTCRMVELDGFATWGLKAKMVWAAPLSAPNGAFHDFSLSFSHLDYPLLLPFLTAGNYAALGGANDMLGKAPLLFLCIAFALLFFGALRAFLPAVLAGAFVAITLAAPEVIRWAVQGVADMPLAIFYAGAIIYALRWIANGAPGELRLAGCFCTACILTKNEGLPLAFFVLLAAVIFGGRRNGRRLREWMMVAVGVAAAVLPWFIFRHSLPHTDENYLAHLNVATLEANFGRLPEILRAIFHGMFFDADWIPLWWLIGALGVAGWRRRSRETLALTFLVVAQFAVYVLAYLISPYPVSALLLDTANRLFVQALPVGMLLAAVCLAEFLPRSEAPNDNSTAACG